MGLTVADIAGLFTAIVTPLNGDGSVDTGALAELVRFQLDAGATGIVPIGGTGEYPAFSREERKQIVRTCVEAAGGKPVVPGVLSTGYRDALEAGRDFADAGAGAVMTVTPYYAEGPAEGIRRYFEQYRKEVGIPVLLYQIPRRTGVAVRPDTINRMADDGSIIGMKFSSYDMPDFIRTIELAGNKIAVLSGEEPLFATHVALGARGGVLASASIYPKIWLKIFEMARSGDLKGALAAQEAIDKVIDAIFVETNPGPLKAYMAMAGRPVGPVRLPLMAPRPDTVEKLKAALAVANEARLS